ncbi:MAG: ABC transporter permease [Clostridium septicum]|uniref:ABC transporter permease n=1 Tax=Clostridium septicum TaxID=1504 RepID=UPI00258EB449|nr:ABC transporter permease [Clostridium septicum]MDU1313693.1 ABC transporter permease [Clostridium septicum]
MKNYLKNSLFITLSITSILLIFSILISEIINEKGILNMCNYTYKNAITFSINKDDPICKTHENTEVIEEIKLFFSYLMEKDDLVVKSVNGKLFSNGFYTNGLYFNSNYTNNYKLLEGRFLDVSDFKNNNKVAVIPKSALKYVESNNDSKFLYSGSEKYTVVGVIDNGKSNQVKFATIFYNLSLNDINLNMDFDNIVIESDIYSNDELIKLVQDNPYIKIKKIKTDFFYKVSIMDFIKIGVFSFIVIYTPLIIVIFISIILCMYYWVNGIKYEIGVKKLCGANTFDIIKEITIKLIFISTISLTLCPIIQNALEFSNILNRSIIYTSYNFILNILFISLICIVLAIISFYKIDKLELVSLIKRR